MAKERWITINGAHVLIKDGESVNQLFEGKQSKKRLNKGKYEHSEDNGKTWEDMDEDSYKELSAEEDNFDENEDADFDPIEYEEFEIEDDDEKEEKEESAHWKELEAKAPEMRQHLIDTIGSSGKNRDKTGEELHNMWVNELKKEFNLTDEEANAVVEQQMYFANDNLENLASKHHTEEVSDEDFSGETPNGSNVKLGDEVSWHGKKGIVKNIKKDEDGFLLKVDFGGEEKYISDFDLDNEVTDAEFTDDKLTEELSDAEYVYAGMGKEQAAKTMSERLGVSLDRAQEFINKNFDEHYWDEKDDESQEEYENRVKNDPEQQKFEKAMKDSGYELKKDEYGIKKSEKPQNIDDDEDYEDEKWQQYYFDQKMKRLEDTDLVLKIQNKMDSAENNIRKIMKEKGYNSKEANEAIQAYIDEFGDYLYSEDVEKINKALKRGE